MMKDVAHVAGKDWLGSMPEIGPAFYVGAEDDRDELHIRLAQIASHYGVTFQDLIRGGLHVLCLLGQDATLCAATGKSGRVEVTLSIANSIELPATSSQRIFRSTRCPAPSPAAKSIAARSMPSRSTCRHSPWWPAARSPC
jgi:hypothetical protein